MRRRARARVIWAEDRVRPSGWIDAIRKAGYRAVPAQDVLARDRRRGEQRLALWRWLVAGFCMMQVMMYATPAYFSAPGEITPEMVQLLRWASWVLTLPVVFFACGPFFANALRDIARRQVSMDLPVALGMAITFAVSTAAHLRSCGPPGQRGVFRLADHVRVLSADRPLARGAAARPHRRRARSAAQPHARNHRASATPTARSSALPCAAWRWATPSA